jgi:hypothetical protein
MQNATGGKLVVKGAAHFTRFFARSLFAFCILHFEFR